MNSMKMQEDMTPEDETHRLVGAQYDTGEEQRHTSGKNEKAVPKWKLCSVVDMCGAESKGQCCKEQYCKEQYCIGAWNARSMNQGKLDVVEQETARMNTDVLGIIELKWMGMAEFNSYDHYIYYCEQESLRRNGVTQWSTKESEMQYLGAISKMTE